MARIGTEWRRAAQAGAGIRADWCRLVQIGRIGVDWCRLVQFMYILPRSLHHVCIIPEKIQTCTLQHRFRSYVSFCFIIFSEFSKTILPGHRSSSEDEVGFLEF